MAGAALGLIVLAAVAWVVFEVGRYVQVDSDRRLIDEFGREGPGGKAK